ncbi:MAG: iron-containing redox enzyme family protein [Myxococcales bacterium]|nr:iron-containing redox enzyme family protein [Myxococcales bacterium]
MEWKQGVLQEALRQAEQSASVIEAADQITRVYDFDVHPYFVWMRDPATTLEAFRASQQPYRYYVEHFSRPLAAVLARIGPAATRIATVFDNVCEEHGRGDVRASHIATFDGYLRALGVPASALSEPCPPAIAGAYEAFLNLALVSEPEVGAASLGFVEYSHIGIAEMLARNMHERFWGDLQAQEHYRFHAEIDMEHASDLFAVCEPAWQAGRRQATIRGLLLGAHYWWSLFRDMLPQPPRAAGRSIREHFASPDRYVDDTRIDVELAAELVTAAATVPATVRVLGAHGAVVAPQGEALAPVDVLTVRVSIDGSAHEFPGAVRSNDRESGLLLVEFTVDARPRAQALRARLAGLR